LSHLSDEELSAATVAARHGVTQRYVHKLFEAEVATFSEFVLARRLQFARRLLTDRRLASRSITSIAFGAGFSDLSHSTVRSAAGATRRADGSEGVGKLAGLNLALIASC
jgi:AraC-like DNA-binding protein